MLRPSGRFKKEAVPIKDYYSPVRLITIFFFYVSGKNKFALIVSHLFLYSFLKPMDYKTLTKKQVFLLAFAVKQYYNNYNVWFNAIYFL